MSHIQSPSVQQDMDKIKKNSRVKKSNVKKSTKLKSKVKKVPSIVPRLRLEPRITPKSSKKKKVQNKNSEGSSSIVKVNEIGGNSSTKLPQSNYEQENVTRRNDYEEENYPDTSDYQEANCIERNNYDEVNSIEMNGHERENSIEGDDCGQEGATSHILNSSFVSKCSSSKASTEILSGFQWDTDEDENLEMKDETKGKKRKKPERQAITRNTHWSDRELMDLAIGLQTEGFADTKKVADYIKTKTEADINVYIRRHASIARKVEQGDRPANRWSTTAPENIATWPNIRKWRKLAHNQILNCIRAKDYSKPVIKALCKRFYEEEKEVTDPQVINVKLIYKYIMNCMTGDIPPQLPPKESALVLDLLREVRSLPLACDFEEELKFLSDFKEATKFRPFQVKDEFKKRFKKALDSESVGPNTVSVPEEIFLELSRHKKLVQSFNPLITPVWMLQKEQEVLEKYSEESNVYVD